MNVMPISSGLNRMLTLFPTKNELDAFWSDMTLYCKENPYLSISTPFNMLNTDFGMGILQCKGCTAGTTRATVSPDMKLIPCGLCPDWIIGDLSQNSFHTIWENQRADTIRELDIPPCKIKKTIW